MGIEFADGEDRLTRRVSDEIAELVRGRKHDHGKPMWHLVPWDAMEEVAHVLTYGAMKYSPGNWRRVEDAGERYWSAAMRHMVAWQGGEWDDEETGRSHLAHAVCCLLFLASLVKERENRG